MSKSTASAARPPHLVAAASAPSASKRTTDAFFRDALLCPDGSCLLATADDRSLSLYALPFGGDEQQPVASTSKLEPAWTHMPSDSVLSSAWYPGASAYDPAMFTFATGVKDHPVHLLDGNDRRVRASYPIIDHTERFVAPHAMTFSPDGSSLYCGFENAVEIFDVSRPGEEGFRMHTTPTRSSRQGQKGIISSLAFSPASTTSGSSLLAAGSFSGSVALYDPAMPKPLANLLFPSQRGGVTKILFNPVSPHLLFVASRHSTHLDVWDLRNTSTRSSGGRLARRAATNQRLGFDIDPSGTWLTAGDEDGKVSIFSAQPLPDQLEAVETFSLGTDPISTALFHPTQPWLITTSGARKFEKRRTSGSRPQRDWLDSDSESDVDADSGREGGAQVATSDAGVTEQQAAAVVANSHERAGALADAPCADTDSLRVWQWSASRDE
ncbi:hypothetical protein BMF94_0005 [Rhodotorula taiwanensis]|uniref:Uncharacterized protein n=1 Tax=Rhodotorula taiwanensis TaxID=741276 RepID=A0A2S5BJ20_9BASI|nr:hypothetical protein BMF94_0005 [Rhodotorula taiwanensis]